MGTLVLVTIFFLLCEVVIFFLPGRMVISFFFRENSGCIPLEVGTLVFFRLGEVMVFFQVSIGVLWMLCMAPLLVENLALRLLFCLVI